MTVNEYHNAYHRIIKMKPVDFKGDTYINIDKQIDDKDSELKVGDHVRMSKYKNILLKDILQIGLKKFLWSKKLEILFHGYVINDLNGEEIIGRFYEKELQKTRI